MVIKNLKYTKQGKSIEPELQPVPIDLFMDESLGKILSQLKSSTRIIKKGGQLFLQGDNVSSFFYLKKGKLKLIRNTIEGGETLIHVAVSHETFAEASLFSNQYHCTAFASVDSEVTCYSKEDFLYYLEQNPFMMKKLLQIFSQQVRDLRAINEIKNISSAKARILAFIKNEMGANQELHLNIVLKDVAYKIGLAHETFYRELKKLEDEHILVRQGSFLKLQ